MKNTAGLVHVIRLARVLEPKLESELAERLHTLGAIKTLDRVIGTSDIETMKACTEDLGAFTGELNTMSLKKVGQAILRLSATASTPDQYGSLSRGFAVVTARLDPVLKREIAETLARKALAVIHRDNSFVKYSQVGPTFERVAPFLNEAAADAFAEELMRHMEATTFSPEIGNLSEGIWHLLSRLNRKAADRMTSAIALKLLALVHSMNNYCDIDA